jgi:hypothetical protein
MSGPGLDSPDRTEKAERQQLERQLEVDDLSWLMSDKRGRRFVWRLLSAAGVYQLSFVAGDQSVTAFREGNRNQGLQLVALVMKHCPERFSEMQKEARNHDRRNERTSSSSGT